MFEKYKRKAEECLGKITNYEERQNAYIFYNDEIEQDGCVVFLKNSGKMLSMSEYIFMME